MPQHNGLRTTAFRSLQPNHFRLHLQHGMIQKCLRQFIQQICDFRRLFGQVDQILIDTRIDRVSETRKQLIANAVPSVVGIRV